MEKAPHALGVTADVCWGTEEKKGKDSRRVERQGRKMKERTDS